MKIPAMNSGLTRNPEPPATIPSTTARPERLLADWRISVLALWAVIYMANEHLMRFLNKRVPPGIRHRSTCIFRWRLLRLENLFSGLGLCFARLGEILGAL